jgi:hypothetical protein
VVRRKGKSQLNDLGYRLAIVITYEIEVEMRSKEKEGLKLFLVLSN